jgi:hypothetical protein
VSSPDPREFLRDPGRFVRRYPLWKARVVRLWTRFDSEITIGLRDLDAQDFQGTPFHQVPAYQRYKPLHERLYNQLEAKTGSKASAVFGMEIPNWLDRTALPDNDYSRLVQQFFSAIQELNALTTTRGQDEFVMSLQCQLYVATYELAAKRLVAATEIIMGRQIPDVGVALSELRNKGHPDLVTSFENTLRNGIAHNNYLIDAGPPATVSYANIGFNRKTAMKTVRTFSKDLNEVKNLTADIMWCMMAGMHVHAGRYQDVVRAALSAVN